MPNDSCDRTQEKPMSSEMVAVTPKLLPCPNPWCHSRTPPLPIRSRMASNGWHVACACGVCSWSKPTEAEAIAAWNTRQQAEARATAGAGVPDGWKLVPVDLIYQPAMRQAGWKHVDTKLFHGLEAQMQAMWSAMLAAVPAPTEAPGSEGAELLAWLATKPNLSLDSFGPVYGDDDDQSEGWKVTRESGSINDREWEVIGKGDTPTAALASSRLALNEQERG